ncbi:MAG: hypothetical protein JO360_15365 [Acidobacteria bacterium]|nr:hypothetical protein [Acidobacteriota bacterium]
MATIEYKVFFDNASAAQDQLDKIEEITVEQEVGMAWEARLLIPVCVNDDGKWEGEEEAWMKPYTRTRVEVSINGGAFVPLIDGPVVGYDTARSSIPGKSFVTLVVHDDSALLHKEDEVKPHQATNDGELARQIFKDAQLGGTPDIDPVPDQPDSKNTEVMQRGTKMELLLSLAKRHRNFYAYVLPGATAGQSIGCFKKLPEQPDGLPPLILFGEDRNTTELQVKNNSRSPSEVTASTMSLGDKGIRTSTNSYRNATLLGKEPPPADAANTTKKRLPPGQTDSVDLDSATAGEAAASGFALEATGSVLPFCYTGVLAPYRIVQAQMSDTSLSANYVIFKVKHTLNRSIYTQAFTLKGNAISPPASTSASAPQPSANLSVSFNMQVSVF